MKATTVPSFVSEYHRYDRMMEPFGDALFQAAALQWGERVLDVGCGAGSTTLTAARYVGPGGGVIGVDVEPTAIELLQRRATSAGLTHLEARCADAQQVSLDPPVDACISRFGTLHFADLVGAYRHLRRQMQPGGRLVFVCGRERERNQWATLPRAAAQRVLGPLPAEKPGTGPFVLSNPDIVHAILDQAGFTSIELTSVDQAVQLGRDIDDAISFFHATDGAKLRDAIGARAYAEVLTELETALEPYATPDGVMVGASVWLVTAVEAANS